MWLRILIAGEGEGVIGIEPAVVGVAAFVAFADGDHDFAPKLVGRNELSVATDIRRKKLVVREPV